MAYNEQDIDAARFWREIEIQHRDQPEEINNYIKYCLLIVAIAALDEGCELFKAIKTAALVNDSDTNNWNFVRVIESNHQIDYLLEKICFVVMEYFGATNLQKTRSSISAEITVRIVSHKLFGLNKVDLKRIFDYGFLYYPYDSTSISSEYEDFHSEFATSIIPPNCKGIISVLGRKGEFALKAKAAAPSLTSVWFPNQQSVSLELLLRLAIYGFTKDNILIGDSQAARGLHYDFLLADTSTIYTLYRNPITSQQYYSRPDTFLPKYYENADLAVTVNSPSRFMHRFAIKQFTKELVENHLLIAILSTPGYRSPKAKSTAALITKREHNISRSDYNSIAISTENITHLYAKENKKPYFGLLANILNLAHPLLINNSIGTQYLNQNDTHRQLFSQAFKGAYRDISGLCKRFKSTLLPEVDYNINIENYVTDDNVLVPWLSSLNYEDILETLHRKGKRKNNNIYLIGNNGEGKSLLLREFAEKKIDNINHTLAITNSPHDRFRNISRENFNYLGTFNAFSATLSKKLKNTPAQLAFTTLTRNDSTKPQEILTSILEIIGFSQQLYLIKPTLNKRKPETSSDLASIISIPPRNNFDEGLIEQIKEGTIPLKEYSLGVKSIKHNNLIVEFSELSSGEQSIILLALKISAYIQDDSLLLIDEPEISLHVKWQKIIPRMIDLFTSAFSSSAIIATHSPLIITEATGDSDYCFVAENRETKQIRPYEMRSIEAILFENFKTHTLNNREVSEKCAKIIRESIEIANRSSTKTEEIEKKISDLTAISDIINNGIRHTNGNSKKFAEDIQFVGKAIDIIKGLIPTSQTNSEDHV